MELDLVIKEVRGETREDQAERTKGGKYLMCVGAYVWRGDDVEWTQVGAVAGVRGSAVGVYGYLPCPCPCPCLNDEALRV